MENIYTDWVLILLAAVLNVVISWLWYSDWMFGSIWASVSKVKSSYSLHCLRNLLFVCMVSFVISYFLSFFQSHLGITSVTDGMFLGLLLWLGFVFTTQIALLKARQQPLVLFLIDTGFKLFSFLVMSGVIGA